MKIRRYLLFLVFTFSALVLTAERENIKAESLDDLRSAFSLKNTEYSSPMELGPVYKAFDLGEQALPFLEGILSDPDSERSYLAGRSIAYIGGTKAAEILRKRYEMKADIGVKTLLCFALSSTGTKQDIEFLTGSLSGEHYGSEWPPIQQAAFSLGTLRVKELKGLLQQTAAKKEGFASAAAESALKWIDGDIWRVAPVQNISIQDSVIFSLIRFGIPRMNESRAFLEKKSNRIWRRKGNSWAPESAEQASPENIPSIVFTVHIAPDSNRAICSVGLTFGPLNGSGYDFVLRKNAGVWEVVGMMATWVS